MNKGVPRSQIPSQITPLEFCIEAFFLYVSYILKSNQSSEIVVIMSQLWKQYPPRTALLMTVVVDARSFGWRQRVSSYFISDQKLPCNLKWNRASERGLVPSPQVHHRKEN